MKKCNFIIKLEFYSGVVGFYAVGSHGPYFSYESTCALLFSNARMAKYFAISLVRQNKDIKMFDIIRITSKS